MSSYRKPKAIAPSAKVTPSDKKVQYKPTLSLPILQIRGIEANKLISSQDYQRPVNQRNVEMIKDGYVKELVNPVKVSLRNGKYYVFDGQHTLTVLTDLFGEKAIIPCIIYNGLTYEREAALFAKQDEFKRKLSRVENLKAMHESGDKQTEEFINTVKKCGFRCEFKNGRHAAPLSISNPKYFYDDIFVKKGKEYLSEILGIIKAAYPDEPSAMANDFVKGLDIFCTLYRGEFSPSDLVAKLIKVSPVTIIRNGKANMTHKGGTKFAVAIFDVYNKGRKTKLRSKF